ncbi:MAG: pyridoxamine 5'-phosphate oxidase family protein [Verrucomicrobiae bacterium]|nr:pyridoxamine 5'-phosphate oxidase family protein [Verrucomicrobiae bacterium]
MTRTSWDMATLPGLVGWIESALVEAVRPGPNPWRTPVLATIGQGGPEARTVVLRGVTLPGFELIAFSDARAAKVSELTSDPRATWVFYDPAARVQLRVRTRVRVHTRDPVSQTYWHRLPGGQRGRYGHGAGPGTPLTDPASGPGPEEAGDEAQFTVLVGATLELDWLWLGDERHRRARFLRAGREWSGEWIQP